MSVIRIEYIFETPTQKSWSFEILLDPKTLLRVPEPTNDSPSWTKLGFHKCKNCPLLDGEHQRCPAALSLVEPVHHFDSVHSHEQVDLQVTLAERTICQRSTVQLAFASLMGLLLGASGCPHLAFFRPMLRFHLPLINEEEAIYRTASMYLLSQYFKLRDGQRADFSFRDLNQTCKSLRTVNLGLANRLRASTKTDSAVNALVSLDSLMQNLPLAIEESLQELRYLYQAHS